MMNALNAGLDYDWSRICGQLNSILDPCTHSSHHHQPFNVAFQCSFPHFNFICLHFPSDNMFLHRQNILRWSLHCEKGVQLNLSKTFTQ